MAEEIGKNKSHVGFMDQVWKQFGYHGSQERSFDSYYQEVKRGPAKSADTDARLIAAELDSGKTVRALADEIGKGKSHVSRMAKVWRPPLGVPPEGQSFNGLYQGESHKSADTDARRATAIKPCAAPCRVLAIPPMPNTRHHGRAHQRAAQPRQQTPGASMVASKTHTRALFDAAARGVGYTDDDIAAASDELGLPELDISAPLHHVAKLQAAGAYWGATDTANASVAYLRWLAGKQTNRRTHKRWRH